MPISYTFEQTVQLTDGNWNREPDPLPTNPETSETVHVDAPPYLSNAVDWTSTLELSVIGDFNGDDEVLEVQITDGEGTVKNAVLFDDDISNDGLFSGQTLPTNGTDNTLIGAQPSQGGVTINGHQGNVPGSEFTALDIADIHENDAVFEGPRVAVSADLSALEGQLEIEFSITEYPSKESGVDFAEIEMDLTVSGEWSSKHAISNVVFYLQDSEGEIYKLKVDDWSDLAAVYKSTELLDFSEENIAEFAAEFCDMDGFDFVGMTIKAGRNFEDGFARNETKGEGEIVFGDILDEYGAANRIDCTVLAEDVISEFLLV